MLTCFDWLSWADLLLAVVPIRSLDVITTFQIRDEYFDGKLRTQPAATSATPTQTNTTPAHRAALTCSPRMYLAPSVPTT
jgi:hypothetical protein